MTKLWTRLYPIDIDRMEWQPVQDGHGLSEKVLARDPADGSITRLLRGEPGAQAPAAVRDRWEEAYVMDGGFRCGDDENPRGSYLCARPGTGRAAIATTEGFVCLQMLDVNPRLDKPDVRLHADEIDRMPWQSTPLRNEAHLQKVLAAGPSGSATRLLRIEMGGDTTELDDHDFDEEVWILEGSVKNGEEFHPAGTYTFNAPHDTHGPFLIAEPLLCFEIRNYS